MLSFNRVRPHKSSPLVVELLESREALTAMPTGGFDTHNTIGTAFDMGTVSQLSPYSHVDAIRIETVNPEYRSGNKKWSENVDWQSSDVDIYKVNVIAGDRLFFEVETWDMEIFWAEPSTPAFPIQHLQQTDIRLALFDAQGNVLPADGGNPVTIPAGRNFNGVPPHDNHNYDLTYTFHRAGTYYLGVSNGYNETYNPTTGTGARASRNFGPYRLTARVLMSDLPDLQAVSLAWNGNYLHLDYKITQEEIWGRRRPADWHHGVKLYWGGNDGAVLGSIDNDEVKRWLNDVGTQILDGEHWYRIDVPINALGQAPTGAKSVQMVVNADRKVPELLANYSNNQAVVRLASSPPKALLDGPAEIKVVAGTTVTFTSLSFDPDDGGNAPGSGIVRFLWFGPGREVLGYNPEGGAVRSFTFEEPGKHTVTLTVTDNEGDIATVEKTVIVPSKKLKPGVYVGARDLDSVWKGDIIWATHQYLILVPSEPARFRGLRDLGDGTLGLIIGAQRSKAIKPRLRVERFESGDVRATQEYTAPEKMAPLFPDFDTEVAQVNLGDIRIDHAIKKILRAADHYAMYEKTHPLYYPTGYFDQFNPRLINSNSWVQSIVEYTIGPGRVQENFNGRDFGYWNRIPRKYFIG